MFREGKVGLDLAGSPKEALLRFHERYTGAQDFVLHCRELPNGQFFDLAQDKTRQNKNRRDGWEVVLTTPSFLNLTYEGRGPTPRVAQTAACSEWVANIEVLAAALKLPPTLAEIKQTLTSSLTMAQRSFIIRTLKREVPEFLAEKAREVHQAFRDLGCSHASWDEEAERASG